MEEVLISKHIKTNASAIYRAYKSFADIIIPNDKYNTVAIDVVRG
jgi:hypothetical protein